MSGCGRARPKDRNLAKLRLDFTFFMDKSDFLENKIASFI